MIIKGAPKKSTGFKEIVVKLIGEIKKRIVCVKGERTNE